MRIVVIAMCGLALLWAPGVHAKEPACPELPPVSAGSSELSAAGEASLVRSFLSALGVEVTRKTSFDDILSRYPNAHQLLVQLQYFAAECHLIINDRTLTEAEKRVELTAVFERIMLRQSTPEISPALRAAPSPPYPTASDMSGLYEVKARYNITATDSKGSVGAYVEQVAGRHGTVEMMSTCVLDIRSGSQGTFAGSLYDKEPTYSFNGRPVYYLPNVAATVGGQMEGSRVTFVARTPNGVEYIAVEGDYLANSIRGNYKLLGPAPNEQHALPLRLHPSLGVQQASIGEFVAERSPPSTPVSNSYRQLHPELSSESAQSFRADRCCIYSLGWCVPWGSTPGGKDSPAELGSPCYCLDRPGVVGQNCQ